MTVAGHHNRCARNWCGADAGDKGCYICIHGVSDADRAGVTSDTDVADIDIVMSRGEIGAGIRAQGDIVAAGSVKKKRTPTNGRVVVAGGVAKERLSANGRVEAADGVELERSSTVSRVADSGGIASERINANGAKPVAVLASPSVLK